LATYTRSLWTVTLTGSVPRDDTVPPGTRLSAPPGLIRSTEIWLLPASTAIRNRPLAEIWSAPWEASPAPVPAPPAVNGEPASAVKVPSARRSNAPIVLVPAVLSLT
jgi:hypothetical protein